MGEKEKIKLEKQEQQIQEMIEANQELVSTLSKLEADKQDITISLETEKEAKKVLNVSYDRLSILFEKEKEESERNYKRVNQFLEKEKEEKLIKEKLCADLMKQKHELEAQKASLEVQLKGNVDEFKKAEEKQQSSEATILKLEANKSEMGASFNEQKIKSEKKVEELQKENNRLKHLEEENDRLKQSAAQLSMYHDQVKEYKNNTKKLNQ